jgi:hypothetical protein
MSTVYLERSDPTVDRILRAAFPACAAKRVAAHVQESVHFYGTQWDEGCKREYAMVRLDNLLHVDVPVQLFMEHSALHDGTHEIPQGCVVVVHVYGRNGETFEILAPAATISPMLPAPVVLTEDERTVLIATWSFKASSRFVEAKRASGITLERYEVAKTALIERRFLDKRGAITASGRNAIGNAQF